MTGDWAQRIEKRIATLETRDAVDEVHRDNVDRRLRAIEDMLKWLVRLVMGALIMAIIAYAVAGGFALSTE